MVESNTTSLLMNALAAYGLATIKKTIDGAMMDPLYMIRLLNFMALQSKLRRADDREAAIVQRREVFKAENWDEYRNIVKSQFLKDDVMD